MLKRIPFHTILFAIFPILALLANNITEVDPRVALRPILISLGAMAVTFLVWSLIVRNWKKGGIITTYLLVLFFTYGHVYEILQKYPVFQFSLGRRRYLLVIYAVILVAGPVWLLWNVKEASSATQFLNIVGLALLIYPTYRVVSYRWNLASSEKKAAKIVVEASELVPNDAHHLPDIYFIVLDTYTSGDALLHHFGYDNSSFLNELRGMGFYVAVCSRSNYEFTLASFTTVLNLDYLTTLKEQLSKEGMNPDQVWTLIKQSQVRKQLEAIGYKTVAFESGYEWTRLKDADIYLSYTTGKPYEMQLLQPFEEMLIRSTMLLVWSDSTYKSLTPYTKTQFKQADFWYEDHINRRCLSSINCLKSPFLLSLSLCLFISISLTSPMCFYPTGIL